MKNDKTDEWGRTLQTTTAPQVGGWLARYTDKGLGYCCLGLGMAVCMSVEPEIEDLVGDDEDVARNVYLFDEAERLPPATFLAWLGFSEEEIRRDGMAQSTAMHDGGNQRTTEYSLFLDWPDDENLVTQCVMDEQEAKEREHDEHYDHGCLERYDATTTTCELSEFNDTLGLTFAQIGDLVRYFGVRLLMRPQDRGAE